MKKNILIFLTFFVLATASSQEDSFYFEDYNDESESLAFQVGGVTDLNTYYSTVYDTFDDVDKGFNAGIDLDLVLESNLIDVVGNINFDIKNFNNIEEFPLQSQAFLTSAYLDTLFIRYYNSNFDLEIGLLKPVWGNADGIHFVDVLNPLDYSDPFGPSYLDKKISQQMLKLNIPIGESSLVELVYLPKFEGDNIPLTGKWQPYYVKNMEDTISNIAYPIAMAKAKELSPATPEALLAPLVVAQAKATSKAVAETLSIDESQYFIDCQAAVRFTTSLNSIDLGFIYYYGFLKTPTIDPQDVIENEELKLIYNRVHVFGFDIATQLGLFNIKGEVSYNMTNDIEGDDPAVSNNSLNYILGFDMNLPVNNINLLLQGVGNTVINSDKITKLDPGYRGDNYSDIMLMARLSDNYINETLFIEVAGVYDFINRDFMLTPKITYKFSDNFESYLLYTTLQGDEDTDFGQFRDNDYIKLGIKYFF